MKLTKSQLADVAIYLLTVARKTHAASCSELAAHSGVDYETVYKCYRNTSVISYAVRDNKTLKHNQMVHFALSAMTPASVRKKALQ